MLDISSDDIVRLSDDDLRSLVGLLCEAELRAHGLTTSAVTWGGNQDAPDGGIDVRVKLVDGEAIDEFIPRANTGFQVKKTISRQELLGPEMRPGGALRDSIRALIGDRGAYIVVSSGSNTANSALTDRLAAMRAAVSDAENNEALQLDFYDRNRLATWTRSHPGLMLWVRQRIGRALSGWRSYTYGHSRRTA